MSSPSRTPDWLLERIAVGELTADELATARARLAQEPEGASRLAALEADNRTTLDTLPPADVAREVSSRIVLAQKVEAAQEQARPLRWFSPAAVLVPVLAAVLFVVVLPGTPSSPGSEPGSPAAEVTRTKGLLPQLAVHRQAAAGPERLPEGAAAAPGDVVQLSYVAAGHPYGAILSVDGRGAVTLHAPESGVQAVPLAPSGAHALPRAYELDDAPSFERFILITSDTPFALDEVLAAARRLAVSTDARTAPLELPARLTQVSFTLEKTSP